MRGEGEAEFVSECLLMNRACIIGMHDVLLSNVHTGAWVSVCVFCLGGSGANFHPARVLED